MDRIIRLNFIPHWPLLEHTQLLLDQERPVHLVSIDASAELLVDLYLPLESRRQMLCEGVDSLERDDALLLCISLPGRGSCELGGEGLAETEAGVLRFGGLFLEQFFVEQIILHEFDVLLHFHLLVFIAKQKVPLVQPLP